MTSTPNHETLVETMARTLLTFAADGADLLMHILVAGAGSAHAVWQSLIAPHDPCGSDSALDHMLRIGMARTGRELRPRALAAFHTTIARWRMRLETAPTPTDETEWASWATHDGEWSIIIPSHECWPTRLHDLPVRSDCAEPLCLWVRGDVHAVAHCAAPLAIVGSRSVNPDGRMIAHDIALRTASTGHTVISGGAKGTDAAAHWGALDAGRAHATIAVFAGGLDYVGPSVNLQLFDRIVDNGGALISEMCPGTVPEPRRFLLRNRIIAALSNTIVVSQARLRSGAINTALWGADIGREVYAVPGSIVHPDWSGCNRLIADNRAALLTSVDEATQLCSDSHDDGDATVSSLLTDRVRTAIRRCRHDHRQPTASAILTMMNMRRTPDQLPVDAAQCAAVLTALVLDGTLNEHNGVYTLASGSSKPAQPRLY